MCCRNEGTGFSFNFCNKYKYNAEIKESENSSAHNFFTLLNNFYHLMMMSFTKIMMQVFYDSLINTVRSIERLQLNYFDRISSAAENKQYTLVPPNTSEYFENTTNFSSYSPQSLKFLKQEKESIIYTEHKKKEKVSKLKYGIFTNQKNYTKSFLNSKNFETNENSMLSKNNKNILSNYFAETKFSDNMNRSCYTNRHKQEVFQKWAIKTADKTKKHKDTSKVPANKISAHQAEVILNSIKKLVQGKNTENMSFECPICHKCIKRLYHFHRHIKIHTGNKEHKCKFCSYSSVRKDNLKSHMKTHERR